MSESGDGLDGAATRLLVAIAVGAALGGALGWWAPSAGVSVGVAGELWLRALQMLVVPLVVASMVDGIASLGDVRRLGAIGARTLAYYLTTSAFAVGLGLVMVNLVEPGVGVPLDAAGDASSLEATDASWSTMLLSLVPDNLVRAALELDLLPLILFSLFFGAALSTLGEAGETLSRVFSQGLEVILRMVQVVMWFAPIGVFGLVAGRFGEAGGGDQVIGLVTSIGWFVAVVVGGLAIHGLVVLPALLAILAGRNPPRYLRGVFDAVATAFATASSAATLPVTMRSTETRGVSRSSTRFVLPLGATVNMDGSALYEAVAAIFIAQAYGIDLTVGQQLIVALTAVLASIGAAGIPEAGLVTMVIVLNAVGLPLEGLGLLLAVDWFLDRFRTAVNVWGDTIGAAVVDTWHDGPTPDAADGQ